MTNITHMTQFVREDALQTALQWMKKYPVVDGLAGAAMHSEDAIQQCIDGLVDAFCAGGGGDDVKEAFMDILFMHWLMKQRMPDKYAIATSVADIEKARVEGKVANIINWQRADALEDDFRWLEMFYINGLRIINFCYSEENKLGYGCLAPNDTGLKRYGQVIVQDCNHLGILLDGSHGGERSTLDMMERSTAPTIFSHSNPKAVWNNGRNISDDQIKACAAKGGVIGCVSFAAFCGDTFNGRHPTLDDWVKCVDYIVNLVGIDHVGIGSDMFKGQNRAGPGGRSTTAAATGWENRTGRRQRDISQGADFDRHDVLGLQGRHDNFPLLVAALVQRGYQEQDAAKIMGGNWLRVYKAAWGS